MISATRGSSVPMITRSGFRKSPIAAPSFRNSGLETTSNGWLVIDAMRSCTFFAVPTGTVDLSTMILYSSIVSAIDRATARTWVRSLDPSSPGGVPTAMKQMSEDWTADWRSVVKTSLSSATFRRTSSRSPGS
jgi:hypothetical protein